MTIGRRADDRRGRRCRRVAYALGEQRAPVTCRPFGRQVEPCPYGAGLAPRAARVRDRAATTTGENLPADDGRSWRAARPSAYATRRNRRPASIVSPASIVMPAASCASSGSGEELRRVARSISRRRADDSDARADSRRIEHTAWPARAGFLLDLVRLEPNSAAADAFLRRTVRCSASSNARRVSTTWWLVGPFRRVAGRAGECPP